MATTTQPEALHFTGNGEADALLAQDPLALLIGFALDQQVPVQTAFTGPLKLKQRLGTLEAGAIAHADPVRLEQAFRENDEYDGRAERVWTDARDGADLRRRIESLPGFGKMKVIALGSVLAKRFGVAAAQELVPNHPTLGDVDSAQALEDYQAKKRAHKASLRAKQS